MKTALKGNIKPMYFIVTSFDYNSLLRITTARFISPFYLSLI